MYGNRWVWPTWKAGGSQANVGRWYPLCRPHIAGQADLGTSRSSGHDWRPNTSCQPHRSHSSTMSASRSCTRT